MQSSEMPINQPIVVTKTDYIYVVATRTDASNVLVVYRNPKTWDIVLDLQLNVEGTNSRIAFLDRVFWSVIVEGRPATERDLEDLGRKTSMNFNVQSQQREIHVSLPKGTN